MPFHQLLGSTLLIFSSDALECQELKRLYSLFNPLTSLRWESPEH